MEGGRLGPDLRIMLGMLREALYALNRVELHVAT